MPCHPIFGKGPFILAVSFETNTQINCHARGFSLSAEVVFCLFCSVLVKTLESGKGQAHGTLKKKITWWGGYQGAECEEEEGRRSY